MAERISAQKRVQASAAEIFAIVSDPAGHVAIDGSGMLVKADGVPVTAVGDTFAMDMDREPLGDIPMGKYRVELTITAFEQDRLVEWTVGTAEHASIGHVYGFELAPGTDGGTLVTNYCDWSAVSEKFKERISWPVVPLHMIEASLVRLEQVVSEQA